MREREEKRRKVRKMVQRPLDTPVQSKVYLSLSWIKVDEISIKRETRFDPPRN